MTEYTILVEEIGGLNAISCPTLDLKHIEHSGKVDEESIRKTIIHYFRWDKADERTNFTVLIDDKTPETPINFNEQRKRESEQYKPKTRNFI